MVDHYMDIIEAKGYPAVPHAYEKAKEKNKCNPAVPYSLQAPVNSNKQQENLI